jgi:hypothetical protein
MIEKEKESFINENNILIATLNNQLHGLKQEIIDKSNEISQISLDLISMKVENKHLHNSIEDFQTKLQSNHTDIESLSCEIINLKASGHEKDILILELNRFIF